MKTVFGLISSCLLLCVQVMPVTAAEWPVLIDWQQKVALSTPFTGKVGSVAVEAGDHVRKGQLLAALDDSLFEAEVNSAASRLKRARVNYEESQRDFDRAKELFDRTVLSTTDFQQAELDHAIATAGYHESQAQLSLAKINRKYTQVRAPFDAVILQRMVHPGESVSNQCQVAPMLLIAASGKMAARGWLPDVAVRKLSVGQAVNLKVGHQQLASHVKHIATQYRDNGDDTEYLVEFTLAQPAGKNLLPGTRAKVIIP